MADRNIIEFKALILPHMSAAYNYAYWLTRNPQSAEDLTQETFMRALSAFDRFRHCQPRAWLMTIVRNTYYNQQQMYRRRGEVVYLDNVHNKDDHANRLVCMQTPEQEILRNTDIDLVRDCINRLTDEHREVIMLRELEGCSYDEMSQILVCPLGTVMSRLSRARKQLKSLLLKQGYRQGEYA